MGRVLGGGKNAATEAPGFSPRFNGIWDVPCARKAFGCFPPAMRKTFGVLGAPLDLCRRSSPPCSPVSRFGSCGGCPVGFSVVLVVGGAGETTSMPCYHPLPPSSELELSLSGSSPKVLVSSCSLCDVNFKSYDINSLPGGRMCAITWSGG